MTPELRLYRLKISKMNIRTLERITAGYKPLPFGSSPKGTLKLPSNCLKTHKV